MFKLNVIFEFVFACTDKHDTQASRKNISKYVLLVNISAVRLEMY